MRRIRNLGGVLLIAVALTLPPIGPSLVPAARGVAMAEPTCASSTAAAIAAPSATWRLAQTGPKLLWQPATFSPTTCQLIAFGHNDIFVVPSAGGTPRRVTNSTNADVCSLSSLDWSPDARWFAFSAYPRSLAGGRIWHIAADGSTKAASLS